MGSDSVSVGSDSVSVGPDRASGYPHIGTDHYYNHLVAWMISLSALLDPGSLKLHSHLWRFVAVLAVSLLSMGRRVAVTCFAETPLSCMEVCGGSDSGWW